MSTPAYVRSLTTCPCCTAPIKVWESLSRPGISVQHREWETELPYTMIWESLITEQQYNPAGLMWKWILECHHEAAFRICEYIVARFKAVYGG